MSSESPSATLLTEHAGDDDADPAWPTAAEWATALDSAYQLAHEYLTTLPELPVNLQASPAEMAQRFDLALPELGCAPDLAVREWFERASPGIVRSPGPRYFGFVTGGDAGGPRRRLARLRD